MKKRKRLRKLRCHNSRRPPKKITVARKRRRKKTQLRQQCGRKSTPSSRITTFHASRHWPAKSSSKTRSETQTIRLCSGAESGSLCDSMGARCRRCTIQGSSAVPTSSPVSHCEAGGNAKSSSGSVDWKPRLTSFDRSFWLCVRRQASNRTDHPPMPIRTISLKIRSAPRATTRAIGTSSTCAFTT